MNALETSGELAGALRSLPEREVAIERLIEAIETDRAMLLATILHSRVTNRDPAQIRRAPSG